MYILQTFLKHIILKGYISVDIFLYGSTDNRSAAIGLGSGLALNRRQAITWTNADPS